MAQRFWEQMFLNCYFSLDGVPSVCRCMLKAMHSEYMVTTSEKSACSSCICRN